MKPYLTVILDSFHEALVSRVLWILLVLETLLLVLLLPLGITGQAGFTLRQEDFYDQGRLIEKVVEAGKSQDPSPGRRIWELLDESTRISLSARPEGTAPSRDFAFTQALQKQIEQPDFFQEADWQEVRLPLAARSLKKKGLDTLPADQQARFNRLALEAAFPDEIAPIPPKQAQLTYFNWELGLPLPVDPEQLFPSINQLVVVALGILLGVAGVFVAVMATASMIPQTFEAGSVDLLLSKPIDRGLLFLAKFVGGCAFIGINAAYLIGGLWLILGVRFGLWNERLLLAIPLYLFLFAIYYGVSSLAGVIWRNAIVSVVLAVAFWFVCWALGTATGLVEQLSLNPRRLVAIVPVGDTWFALDQREVFRWNDSEEAWTKTFYQRGERPLPFGMPGGMVAPVYQPSQQRIVAFNRTLPGMPGPPGSNRLLFGRQSEDWRRVESIKMPEGAAALFVARSGDLLTVSPQGIYRLEEESSTPPEPKTEGEPSEETRADSKFVNIGPKLRLRNPLSAAMDPQSGAIGLFDGNRLVLCERGADGKYTEKSSLDFENRLNGRIALAGDEVFLALADGEVRRYGSDLVAREPIDSGVGSTPMVASVSPDGRYLAILFSNYRLWLYDLRDARIPPWSIAGQGDVSGVAFDGEHLFVADRVSRVTQYDLKTGAIGRQVSGAMPLAEKIYRYALHPIYTVFPKPGQLDQTVSYLLTSKDSRIQGVRLNDDARPARQDVWGPVWSNSLFLLVVLTVACVYIYRKDF